MSVKAGALKGTIKYILEKLSTEDVSNILKNFPIETLTAFKMSLKIWERNNKYTSNSNKVHHKKIKEDDFVVVNNHEDEHGMKPDTVSKPSKVQDV